ncbi:MAG: GNAT family N-acetyltransferase [Erythrobacter sp.]|nr:GNAT family N-acetyltransferase [Erythrobacter sp.]
MPVRILFNREELEPHIESIRKAADSERSSFGFLPPNAYREFVQQGRAVAAISSTTGELAGYCLYGGVFPQAKIFQTYVAPDFRGQAIGERLLTSVLERLEQRGFLSAVASVAADLSAANRFYEKMGFDVVATKEGGKTTKRLIRVRAKELSSPSLLDLVDQPASQARAPAMRGPRTTPVPRYVLDLNVIFDVTKKRPRSEVAQGVVAAALENDVKLAITAEITAELEKHSREDEPDPILNLCRAIPTLRLPNQKTLSRLREELLPIVFPEKARQTTLKANDEADLRHLATAIEENVVGFITSDEAILRAADKLNARYNLIILSPSTFGQGFEAEFGARPRPFIHTASSTLEPTSFEERDREATEQLLRDYHLSDIRIRGILAAGTATAPRRRELVRSADGLVCFASWDSPRPSVVERALHIYADETHPDAVLAIKHLLRIACQDIDACPVAIFRIKPHLMQHLIRKVAVAYHFYADETDAPRNPTLRKVSLGRAVQCENWPHAASTIEEATGVKLTGEPSATHADAIQLTDVSGSKRYASLKEIEELFSPTIICARDRPGVILPIRTGYAEELFHGGQQPYLLDHAQAALKNTKAYIGGNYGSVPEGGLAFFYESAPRGGRKAITAVARILARYALPPDQAAAISQDRGVFPVTEIENARGRVLKTVIDIDTVMLFRNPIGKDRLCEIGCWDGANLVTAKVIDPASVSKLMEEGMPQLG